MKKYAVVIGVQDYRDKSIAPLMYARDDASALSEKLQSRCGFDRVISLTELGGDSEPIHLNIADALDSVNLEIRHDDLFLFFFAGHGIERDGKGYLLTRDAKKGHGVGHLGLDELRLTIDRMECSTRVLLLDACRNSPDVVRSDSANLMSECFEGFARDIKATRATESQLRGTTTAILMACSPGQRAYEWPEKKHGVFTHFVLKGLDTPHLFESGLDFESLARYVHREVQGWSTRARNQQDPFYLREGVAKVFLGQPREVGEPDKPVLLSSSLKGRVELVETGAVTIISTPVGARVLVNGKDVGITPVIVDLKTGHYRIEASLDGYELFKSAFNYAEIGDCDLEFEMSPSKQGSADVTVQKSAFEVLQFQPDEKTANICSEDQKADVGSPVSSTETAWSDVSKKLAVGDKVCGTILSLSDDSAMVELEEGVNGLIDVNDLGWNAQIRHPSEVLRVGDRVAAIVLAVDEGIEKLSLGIKQLEPDPWPLFIEKYPIGSRTPGKVLELTSSGASVELEGGIEGFVRLSDISWNRLIQHSAEKMRVGQGIDAIVLSIDQQKRRVSLGCKQLDENPWPEYALRYSVGSECVGVITRVLDNAVVVRLGNEVEGLVSTDDLDETELCRFSEDFREGFEIPVTVVKFDPALFRIVLSIKGHIPIHESSQRHSTLAEISERGSLEVAFRADSKTETPREADNQAERNTHLHSHDVDEAQTELNASRPQNDSAEISSAETKQTLYLDQFDCAVDSAKKPRLKTVVSVVLSMVGLLLLVYFASRSNDHPDQTPLMNKSSNYRPGDGSPSDAAVSSVRNKKAPSQDTSNSQIERSTPRKKALVSSAPVMIYILNPTREGCDVHIQIRIDGKEPGLSGYFWAAHVGAEANPIETTTGQHVLTICLTFDCDTEVIYPCKDFSVYISKEIVFEVRVAGSTIELVTHDAYKYFN